jgi:hypothetical protein
MGEIINAVDERDFVRKPFNGNVFAVQDENAAEAGRITESLS